MPHGQVVDFLEIPLKMKNIIRHMRTYVIRGGKEDSYIRKEVIGNHDGKKTFL